jgi:7-cyano-7-deazaguanine reductase
MSGQDADEVAHLEKFDAPDRSHIATFETDELTALCPFDFGGPDHYELTLRYEPDDDAVESKSLKQYLEAFRSREITAEALATEIADAVEETISPDRIYVRLEQARRGGIEETVEVGDRDL